MAGRIRSSRRGGMLLALTCILACARLAASDAGAGSGVEIRYDGGSGGGLGISTATPAARNTSFIVNTVAFEAPPDRAKPLINRDEVPHQLPDGQLHNWGKGYWFRPAKVIEANTFDDVIRVITDHANYPSPVRANGNLHSVTEAVVNAGGTVILMRNLRGVREAGWNAYLGCHTAVALAGTSLIELYTLLGKQGYEVAFQAEIGDATIGATSVSQTKDSGPTPGDEFGTVYKEVAGLKYVDHEGRVVELNKRDHPRELAAFKCSEGLLGVVLEVTVRCFPQRLVTMTYTNMPTTGVIARIARGELVTPESNVWMMFGPENTYVETRRWAKPEEKPTPKMTFLTQLLKQVQFQLARSIIPPWIIRTVSPMLVYTCYRREQVVKYREPGMWEFRQDFSWYEYPMERWEEIATAYAQFMRDFAASHNGFAITGAAVYFVKRIPEKPHGWFSQKGHGFEHEGISFNLDPVFSDPNSQVWKEYIKANTAFALAHGGRLSVIQTRLLNATQYFTAPGVQPLAQAPNRRFTTPFLEQFVAKAGSLLLCYTLVASYLVERVEGVHRYAEDDGRLTAYEWCRDRGFGRCLAYLRGEAAGVGWEEEEDEKEEVERVVEVGVREEEEEEDVAAQLSALSLERDEQPQQELQQEQEQEPDQPPEETGEEEVDVAAQLSALTVHEEDEKKEEEEEEEEPATTEPSGGSEAIEVAGTEEAVAAAAAAPVELSEAPEDDKAEEGVGEPEAAPEAPDAEQGKSEEDEEAYLLAHASSEDVCPLSGQLLTDPAIASDGITYQKGPMEAYIAAERAADRPLKSPKTGEPLADVLFPNFVVRSLVAAYIEAKRQEFRGRK